MLRHAELMVVRVFLRAILVQAFLVQIICVGVSAKQPVENTENKYTLSKVRHVGRKCTKLVWYVAGHDVALSSVSALQEMSGHIYDKARLDAICIFSRAANEYCLRLERNILLNVACNYAYGELVKIYSELLHKRISVTNSFARLNECVYTTTPVIIDKDIESKYAVKLTDSDVALHNVLQQYHMYGERDKKISVYFYTEDVSILQIDCLLMVKPLLHPIDGQTIQDAQTGQALLKVYLDYAASTLKRIDTDLMRSAKNIPTPQARKAAIQQTLIYRDVVLNVIREVKNPPQPVPASDARREQ